MQMAHVFKETLKSLFYEYPHIFDFHPQELEAFIVSDLIKPEGGVIKDIAFVSLVLWLFQSLIACLNYRNQTSYRLHFTVCIQSLSLYSNSNCAKSVLSCTC